MRAKVISGLLALLLLGLGGCSANMSVVGPAPCRSDPTAEAMLMGRLGAEKEADTDFDEALTLIAELKYSQARMRLLPLVEMYEASGKRSRLAEATFWVGYCYEKEGRGDDAAEHYNSVIRRYPRTSAARQSRERLFHLPALSGE